MFERMLVRSIVPTEEDIDKYLGTSSVNLLMLFEKELSKRYDIDRELTFPFGNNYGWSYKYSHKGKHLCHLLFEKEAFTVLLQINGKGKDKLESILEELQPKSKELWKNRYPCGEGGWIYYRVIHHDDISDIMRFIEIKKAAVKAKGYK